MGQGVYTSMPMLIAEELNVDIRKIKVAIAPPNAKLYGNALLGGPQLTGGSTSVRDGWEKLRIAGAQVREMLITAAADKWKVDRCHAHGRERHGAPAPAARRRPTASSPQRRRKLPVPEKVALKDPKDFTHRRQAHQAPRHAGQGQRHGRVRHRREAAGHGLRVARAVPGDRRHGQELRRQPRRKAMPGVHRRRADPRRRRRRGRHLVAREEGARRR